MSDFLAEARVLIRPDTTKFREELQTAINTATKGVTATVPVVATATGAGAAVGKKAATAKQEEAAANRLLEQSELALAAAQEKSLLATTQLGAARARLTGAVAAVAAAEKGLAAAERSKNADLIAAAEATLALAEAEEVRARGVARTVILSNAQEQALAREARAEALAAKAALEHAAATTQVAGAQSARITATAAVTGATAELAQIQALAVKSANDLATAQLRTITAASEQGAAQITAAAAVRTAAIAQEQLALALRTGNVQLVEAAALTVLLANAHEAEALAALSATRAENAHAASLANVQKAGIASTAGLIGLRGAVLTAGAGFIAATVAFQATIRAIGQAADLETQLNVFRVTAGATADEMERVSEAAEQLGKDITLPGVTAGAAAEALTELSKAGLDVEDSLDGARGVLQLATAAQIDNAQAAQLSANALNAFGLAGTDASKVADLLAGAAQESQGSIEDLGIGLRQVAGAAAPLGLTLEDTVALLTQLTRAGLAGSDAGTTLRVALTRLARPDVRKEVEAMVGSLQDLQGNLNPLKIVKLAQEIDKSGGALDKTNKLYQLFGENSQRVIGLLANEGVPGFNAISDSITRSGLAADTAAARMSGFEGSVENLKNQADALGLTFAKGVIPPLSLYADLMADVVRRQTDVTQSNIKTAESAKGLGERLIEFATGSETAGQKTGDFAEKVAGLGARMQFLGPVTLAASLAIDRFGGGLSEAEKEVRALNEAAVVLGENLRRGLTRTGEVIADIAGAGAAEGLNVQQVLNRVAGFDSAETRARIRQSTDEILAVLQDEQAFLEAQLQRAFVKRRPGLQRQLENALFGVVNDIGAITSAGAADAKRAAADAKSAAEDAARAMAEADQVLLDLMGQRRDDAGRKAAVAAQTEGIQDDIRAQNAIQALIKQQIEKIRDRIKDEETRKAAIRALRIALISSRAEEEALRAQQKADAQARIDAIQELNIAIAEETGNDAALKRAINARIKRLNDLIDAAKGDQVKVKQLKLERARLKNQLDELKEQDKETGKSARQEAAAFLFEQLQAQQGFAANLLGNLITGPTAGLVGVPSPGTQTKTASAAAEARSVFGPSAGQTNTQTNVLEKILVELKKLNGSYDAPEAINNKKSGGAALDYAAM